MRNLARVMLGALLALLCLTALSALGRQNGAVRAAGSDVQVDSTSIGDTVLNSDGGKPEAGVWVIAEAKSLPVPFRKIVVTDDQGRFLVPDLPNGAYELWVRGYGLKDSERAKASCGDNVKLQVANAASPQEAAKIYPAAYWTSLIHPPAKEDPKKETFSTFRMPYPMSFYTRGLEGRIDSANGGWKGRGLWMTYSSYLPKFTETKLGSVDHVQLRPNPLAK
jgi:hypothetical protein